MHRILRFTSQFPSLLSLDLPDTLDHLELHPTRPDVGHVVPVHQVGSESEPNVELRMPLEDGPAQAGPPHEPAPQALGPGLQVAVVLIHSVIRLKSNLYRV